MPFGISAGAGAAIAGGLSAAGGVASGLIQSGTAGAASKQAQHNLELVLPQMQTSYNQVLGQYQPYAAGGAASTADMQDLLGLNGPDAASAAMAKFQSSPGYQWQLGQGLRAVDAGAASQGMLRSGATLKAEQTYGQGLADQDFGQYYARLAGLSGQGLTAASGIAGANNALISQETGNAGAVNNAIIGGANAQNSILGNTTSGLTTSINSLMNNPQFTNWAFGSANYGSAAPNTPGISASGNPVMTGFAPAYSPGQVGVGGFVAPQY